MSHLKEIRVKLKGEDQKYSKDFLCYEENVTLDITNPVLKDYVDQARKEVKSEFDECEIVIKMIWS